MLTVNTACSVALYCAALMLPRLLRLQLPELSTVNQCKLLHVSTLGPSVLTTSCREFLPYPVLARTPCSKKRGPTMPLCLSQVTDSWLQKLRRQNLMMRFFETPCNLTKKWSAGVFYPCPPKKIRNRFKTRNLCNDHILMFQFAGTFLPSLRKESLRDIFYRAKTPLIALSLFKSFI